jgi:CDGSH-type Zn-finger protein
MWRDSPMEDGGTNARDDARWVQIVACTDGPLLVRGAARIVDARGEPIEPRRRTVALCRCGASSLKPFCDGTHKAIGFRTGETAD